MFIRTLTTEDLPALLALYAHLHSSDDPLPPAPVVQSVWAEVMQNEKIRYFGALLEGSLVASCNVTVIPNLTRGCKPYGIIENVVTHTDHRRRGYGKAVLCAALSHAWNIGCYKVMLLTGRKDPGTLHFYESAGFDGHAKHAFIAKPMP